MGKTFSTRCHLPVSSLVFNLVIFFLASGSLAAQEKTEFDPPRDLPMLMPSVAGWIGFDQGPLATRLILFDSLFVEQIQSLWTGLEPLDYVDHFESERRDTTGLLLALAEGVPTLYECSLRNRLNLEPRWGARANFQPTGLLSLPDRGALLYSSTEISLIDSTWENVRNRRLDLLYPPMLVGRHKVLVLHTDFAGVHISWISAVDLSLVRELREAITGNRPDARIISIENELYLLLNFHDAGRLSLVNLETGVRRSFVGTRSRSSMPLLFYRGGELIGGSLENEYPAPSIAAGSGQRENIEIRYPLATPPRQIVEMDSIILLLTGDSIALYRSDMTPLSVEAYESGASPRIYRTGIVSHPYLLTSSSGSRLISPGEPQPVNIQDYIPQLLYGLLAVAVIGAMVLVAVRYRRMRAIYRSLVYGDGSSGVLIFSRRSRLLRINAPAYKLLGLPDSTPRGRHALTYFQSEGLGEVRRIVADHINQGTPVDETITLARGSDSIALRLGIRRMIGRYGSNRGFLVVLEDTSDAVERDRLLNWASVAHHIAHEMKTPLGTIRMSSDRLRGALLSDGADDSTLGTLGRIIRESARLREIVEDLLTVARTDQMILNTVDLVLMLRSLADDMREYLPESATIAVESDLASCTLEADADQLAVALRNILDNARQAVGSRANGMIRCRLELQDGEPAARITVTDNGIGMSEETQRRLFQPFYTEKEGGSGIGTTIIKRVIEGHGGTISVESRLGEGTTFTLLIPRTRGENESS